MQSNLGTWANGINNAGQIVGYYYDANGFHGFVDNGGTFTTVNEPLAPSSTYVLGMNDAGQIVGFTQGPSFSFLDNGGTFTTIADPLATPFGGLTAVFGLNDAGQIVGYYADAGGIHGFLNDGGTFNALDDPSAIQSHTQYGAGTAAEGINNADQIVGYYTDETGLHGFLAEPSAEVLPEPGYWMVAGALFAAIFGVNVWRMRARRA